MMKDKIKYVWKLIDHALFGKTPPKKILKERYDDYCAIKSALLTEAFEMYKVLFKDKDWDKFYTNDIPSVIKKAKSLTENVIKRTDIKSTIKQKVLKEMIECEQSNSNKNIDELVKEETVRTTLNMLLDSLLLAEAIDKSDNWNEITKTSEFDIIKGSYDLFKQELSDLIMRNI